MRIRMMTMALVLAMAGHGPGRHARDDAGNAGPLHAVSRRAGRQLHVLVAAQVEAGGREKVIVWPTVKDAWLVTVEKPCSQLEWARGIGFGSQQSHQVQVRIDHLEVGNQRCRIEEIRPIDVEAMNKAR